jgi:mono/diheme cytochrome c family protein
LTQLAGTIGSRQAPTATSGRGLRFAAAAFLAASTILAAVRAGAQASVERGEQIFRAAGCFACHTDVKNNGAALAGGPAIQTPFGTFYGPNITPDPVHGIGRWSADDLVRALRQGRSPSGKYYYPSFPFVAYAQADERDLRDLAAYVMAQKPVAQPSRRHELDFPFSIRLALLPWRWLNFDPAPLRPDPSKSDIVNRGRYLVEALGHCGECHTPRTRMGALDPARRLAGARLEPTRDVAPNLTPHATGLEEWTEADIAGALEFGLTPDGSALAGSMAEVIQHSTSKLSAADRNAIAAYLKSLPPVPFAVRR